MRKENFTRYLFMIVLILASIIKGIAQSIAITSDGSAPNSAAMLDVKSTTKGFLMPRMTFAQRNAITTPATGLMIYQTDNTPGFYFYNGASWIQFSTGSATNYWSVSGSDIFNNNVGNIGIGISAPLAPLHIKKDLESLRIQGSTPYISFYDNPGTSLKGFVQQFNDNFLLGTPSNNTNGIMQLYLKNVPIMTLLPTGEVGIGTSSPASPLSFPNVLGNKISLYHAGVNSDYGIGINTGVMQIYTAGTDKIAFGYGNTNSFTESLSILTGTGFVKYPNILGDKITFYSNGTNSDYGISINTGVMQIHTAGTDRIAFGYGSVATFNEKISFYTGTGQVGIGTTNVSGYQLAVNGNIRSKEVVVETGWADYVFDNSYKLRSLSEVEKFIASNKHLPDIPSAKEIQQNGLALGDLQTKMMQKIEELTLYVIELEKQVRELKENKK